jgi:hypothetical protein
MFSITHKILARGLRSCLCFKDDSTAAATKYITSINASASQLNQMQPMTVQSVPDVYTLVTLMGIYLSEASSHQRAYNELLAHVDDGHALTLDKVQNAIILFSRSSVTRAFALTHTGYTQACTHGCLRCCVAPRADTPRRTSSSPGRRSSPPRLHHTFCSLHDYKYWNKMGLDYYYQTFAYVLETNCVSPHQVLFETGTNDFAHHNTGHAFTVAATKFPMSDIDSSSRLLSVMVPISLSFSLSCLLGSYLHSFGGLSIWRSVFCFCFICLHVSVLKGWINFLSLTDGLTI